MIPSIITIISGNLSQNSGGYNSDIIGIRDIICFSNKSGILPETYFVTSHHMFSIISGILGIFSHSECGEHCKVQWVGSSMSVRIGHNEDTMINAYGHKGCIVGPQWLPRRSLRRASFGMYGHEMRNFAAIGDRSHHEGFWDCEH